MRFTLIASGLVALALAAPRPQEIGFDLVDAAPDAQIDTAPSDVTSESVPIQPVAVAISVGDNSITDTAQAKKKHKRVDRDGDCDPQPAGTGPRVSM